MLIAMACFVLVGCKVDEPISLKIAHVNDTHSHFDEEIMTIGLPDANGNPTFTHTYVGGYPRLKTKVDQLRRESMVEGKGFLLLHAGDAFTGSLFFTLYQGVLNTELMNYIEFDAMSIGNHEFDLGNEVLSNFSNSLNFPLLSANVKTKGRDPLHDSYLPFTIKMFEDNAIAIVGLTTEYTEIISSPSDDTLFLNVQKVAKKIVKSLSSAGIDKIIFLTHLGHEEDRQLANAVAGIDVIIGGHSHELFGDHSNIGLGYQEPSPIMEVDPNGDPVCIMQSGENAQVIGVTDIEFSGDGIVESCVGQNVFLVSNIFAQGNPPQPVDAVTTQNITDFIVNNNNIEIVEKDVTAQVIVDQAKVEVDAFVSTVVGVANGPIYHVRLPGDPHPDAGVMTSGSMVAAHVAQSMAFKMHQITGQHYVAMMNAGGVRADFSGEITIGSIYSVLPFGSTLVSMSVTGESLLNTLSVNVSNAYLISSVAFPYVANLRYTVNLTDSNNPHVENVQVLDAHGIYQAIDPAARYNLVTTSYLAGGGDLYIYEMAHNVIDTGHVDADVLAQYIQAQPNHVLNIIDNNIDIIQ
jgi:5'-nucleotidase